MSNLAVKIESTQESIYESRKHAVPNSVVRSNVRPALKALYAIMSIISSPYHKTTYSTLKPFLKERRTATENRLSELSENLPIMVSMSKNYTLVPANILLSAYLSLAAKGIYMMIKSYATFSGYVINKNTFGSKSKMGRDSFNKVWNELQDAGILKKSRQRVNGKYAENTYILSEIEATDITITSCDGTDTAFYNKITRQKAANNCSSEAAPSAAESDKISRRNACDISCKILEYDRQQRVVFKELYIAAETTPQTSKYKTSNTKYQIGQTFNGNRNNFTQRDYSADFLNGFMLDLSVASAL